MKEMYRVQMMTGNDYDKYMTGSYFYLVKEFDVEAENAEEAIQIARRENPTMVINEKYVKPVAIIEAEENAKRIEREKRIAEENAKKEKARCKKIATEQRKAEEMGMTVADYRKFVRYQREIRKMEKEITRMQEEIAYRKKFIEKVR